MAERVRGREDDDGPARPPDAPLRHPGDRQRQLAPQDPHLRAGDAALLHGRLHAPASAPAVPNTTAAWVGPSWTPSRVPIARRLTRSTGAGRRASLWASVLFSPGCFRKAPR